MTNVGKFATNVLFVFFVSLKDNRPCDDDEDEEEKYSEDDEDVNEGDNDDKDDDDNDCRPCEAEQALIFEPLVQLALSFAYLTIFLVRIL